MESAQDHFFLHDDGSLSLEAQHELDLCRQCSGSQDSLRNGAPNGADRRNAIAFIKVAQGPLIPKPSQGMSGTASRDCNGGFAIAAKGNLKRHVRTAFTCEVLASKQQLGLNAKSSIQALALLLADQT